MYFLASDFFEKDDKYVLKARNSFVVCREFLAFNVFIFFSLSKSDDYLYLYIRNLENSR